MLTVLYLSFLVACNAQLTSSTTKQQKSEENTLIVVNHYSEADAKNISINDSVFISFNQKLKMESISNSHIYIEGAPGDIRYNPDNLSINYIPNQPLIADTKYTIIITNDIETDVGETLPDSYTWSFTTEVEVEPEINNTAPIVFTDENHLVFEGASAQLNGYGEDNDGTIVSYAWTQLSGPTVTLNNANNSTASFTAPAVNAATPLSFKLTVTDNKNSIGNNEIVITILPLNKAPIAINDNYQVLQNQVLSVATPGILANDTDPEDSPITAVLANTALNGALVLNANGSFTYTPNAGFTGVDSFTYHANDGSLQSAFSIVKISVTEPDNIPPATNIEDDFEINENSLVQLIGSGLDSDGTIISYSWHQLTGPA